MATTCACRIPDLTESARSELAKLASAICRGRASLIRNVRRGRLEAL